jgi:outer membrane receptor for ferrienterochelin and colicins
MIITRSVQLSVTAAILAALVSTAPAAYAQATRRDEEEEHEAAESAEIVVQATRSGRRVGDEPIRVEVIDAEELNEKITMVPGNISMLVAETNGLQVQVTAPGLGAANIRVRGLDGRYTQILADGLPLFGGQAPSLGLLQIPPTDLARVEVIKGAASALYGASALGGVINLVSRRPKDEFNANVLFNATHRDGQDLTGYAAAPLGGAWGGSLTGGLNRQTAQDRDGDGFADIAGYRRATMRPRLFWTGDDGAKALLTAGYLTEDRVGGTLGSAVLPNGRPSRETQATEQFDAGLVGEWPLEGVGRLHLRASATSQTVQRTYGATRQDERRSTLFGEASVAGGSERTSWAIGAAVQSDRFRSPQFAAFDYRYTVPGVFAQVDQNIGEVITIAGSARLDFHNRYGTSLSPRLSVLYKPEGWTVRGSVGRGFFAPTPFVDEIESAGLARLAPLSGLKAEIADSASIDVGRSFGRTEINASVFGSRVDNAAALVPLAGGTGVRLVNNPGQVRTRGFELLVRHRWRELVLSASYVLLDATEPAPSSGRQSVARTPRNTFGAVAIWEVEDRGRIGIEAFYTGKQRLDDDPFRTVSRPFVQLGLSGELKLGAASLFLNLENILDARQTRYSRLVRPTPAIDGRRTIDAWAPLEGFVANAGVKVRLGE